MINFRWTIACLLTAVALTRPGLAQTASVPPPNPNGDFTTALQPGSRGNVYPTRKWLVVDPDPTYLNCRTTPNGPVRSRVAPGAILTAVFWDAGDAIISHNGSYWLRVSGTDPLTVPLTDRDPGVCYVRANRRYIAPISEDALQGNLLSD